MNASHDDTQGRIEEATWVESEDPIENTQTIPSLELVEALGLTKLAVEKIQEVMSAMGTTFVDAAERLGLRTRADIEAALIKIRSNHIEDETPEVGMIENAIRRISADRAVVLRQGERVKPGPQLIIAHDPDNPRSERLRALRTELLLLHEAGRGANIIAVLSPGSGEGRTQLAAELAISFAQLGRRTLLVDADMRKPGQHLLFGASNSSGLSQSVARNECLIFIRSKTCHSCISSRLDRCPRTRWNCCPTADSPSC